MASLSVIISQMEEAVLSLHQVMQAEHQQLSAEEINGSLLQRITEEKISLLATLDYLEQQRQLHWDGETNSQHTWRWQQLITPLQQLSDLNQHNGWLLEWQLDHTSKALEILRPYQENSLYGADGYTTASKRSGKKISV